MNPSRAANFALGLVVRFVLGRVQRPTAGARQAPSRAQRREQRRAQERRAEEHVAALAPPKRTPLLLLMLGSFALSLPLMIAFHHPLTRILGVALLFTFIVTGVFLIANPAFLAGEEEG